VLSAAKGRGPHLAPGLATRIIQNKGGLGRGGVKKEKNYQEQNSSPTAKWLDGGPIDGSAKNLAKMSRSLREKKEKDKLTDGGDLGLDFQRGDAMRGNFN